MSAPQDAQALAREVRPLLASPREHLAALQAALIDPERLWVSEDRAWLPARKPAIEPPLGAALRDEIAAALLPFLEDADFDVRSKAAYCLYLSPSPRAREALVGALDDLDPFSRNYALSALADIMGGEAFEILRPWLDAPGAGDRIAAAAALSVLERPEVAPLLADRLDRETEASVRMGLIHALGRCGGPEHAERLAGMLCAEQTDFVTAQACTNALSALAQTAVPAVLDALSTCSQARGVHRLLGVLEALAPTSAQAIQDHPALAAHRAHPDPEVAQRASALLEGCSTFEGQFAGEAEACPGVGDVPERERQR